MSLAAARARLAGVGAADPTARAQALIDLAELEPLFAHRVGVVRPLLLECGALLDSLGDKSLEGRVLLRLADIKMVERSPRCRTACRTRAPAARVPTPTARLLHAASSRARAIRRREFVGARDKLVQLGDQLTTTTRRQKRPQRGARLPLSRSRGRSSRWKSSSTARL